MFAAAESSEYGKDPSNPNAPGNLTRFFTTLANNNIGVFCMLFGKIDFLGKFIPSQRGLSKLLTNLLMTSSALSKLPACRAS